MEWVDGTPIVVPGQQLLAFEDTLRLAEEIVSAMAATHAKEILHRGLKPANILFPSGVQPSCWILALRGSFKRSTSPDSLRSQAKGS